MIEFKLLDPRYGYEALGLIPEFFMESSSATAAEQLNLCYAHGGGWSPMKGWSMGPVGEIKYPGDPALFPIAIAQLNSEIIRVYRNAWVSITQPDGSFEISRID